LFLSLATQQESANFSHSHLLYIVLIERCLVSSVPTCTSCMRHAYHLDTLLLLLLMYMCRPHHMCYECYLPLSFPAVCHSLHPSSVPPAPSGHQARACAACTTHIKFS
jgi:hypothetical protein